MYTSVAPTVPIATATPMPMPALDPTLRPDDDVIGLVEVFVEDPVLVIEGDGVVELADVEGGAVEYAPPS